MICLLLLRSRNRKCHNQVFSPCLTNLTNLVFCRLAEVMPLQYVHTSSESEQDRLLNQFFTTSFRKGHVRIGPNKVLMPVYYVGYADRVENMEVRDSDVWVVTHPKAGRPLYGGLTMVLCSCRYLIPGRCPSSCIRTR